MSIAWLHGASVGDVRALHVLSKHLRVARPELSFKVSAMTSNGREMARALFPDESVTRPPLEFPGCAGRALRQTRPSILLLEYLELWPLWVSACQRLRIPVVVVDGRVTQRSLRIRPILRGSAGSISLFCAQTHGDARRAIELGVRPDRVAVYGNAKFDGVLDGPPVVPHEFKSTLGDFDVVVGSLHPSEERDFIRSVLNTPFRVLVAPRYPRRARAIVRAVERAGIEVALRSEGPTRARIVVLDTIGELSMAYGLGRVAIAGGSFCHREGQNLVEAAAHGVTIIHGPRHANIEVEVQAFTGRGAWCAADWPEAFGLAQRRLLEPGPDPRPVLLELSGSAARQVAAILPLLPP